MGYNFLWILLELRAAWVPEEKLHCTTGPWQGVVENAATNNSTLMVNGRVKRRPARMLIDSGSAVSILCQDIWRTCITAAGCELDSAVPSVVAANGGALNILGRTEIAIEVTGLKVNFPFLVAEKLTQECVLGADFLKQHKCVIDLGE